MQVPQPELAIKKIKSERPWRKGLSIQLLKSEGMLFTQIPNLRQLLLVAGVRDLQTPSSLFRVREDQADDLAAHAEGQGFCPLFDCQIARDVAEETDLHVEGFSSVDYVGRLADAQERPVVEFSVHICFETGNTQRPHTTCGMCLSGLPGL